MDGGGSALEGYQGGPSAREEEAKGGKRRTSDLGSWTLDLGSLGMGMGDGPPFHKTNCGGASHCALR